jgi:hypothetical protein
VTATDGVVNATAVISVNVNTSTFRLVEPSGVNVVAGNHFAVVTWNAVSGATRYTAQAFISPTSTTVLRQCSVSGIGGASTFTCTVPRLQSRSTYYSCNATRSWCTQ